MSIKAAIFDCDGTLLDSMPMWRTATKELFSRYGVEATQAIFDAIEPLSLPETCAYMHVELGIGKSADDVSHTLDEIVHKGYASCPGPLPHVVHFLENLRAHGVKMAVASSTSQKNLNFALEHFGIAHFFEKTFSTGGSIRSKEYPDIWEVACEYLGYDAEDTWVFEDAPFGVREAKRVGMHTVCIFDAHIQRDFDTCKAYSDIMITSYADLSYDRLNSWEKDEPTDLSHEAFQVLIVGGSPEHPSSALLQDLAHHADYVIAADAGTNLLYKNNIVPDVYCGDSDSIEAKALSWVHEHAPISYDLPPKKYATDLGHAFELAYKAARAAHKTLYLTCTAVSGGRPDHAMGVVALMLRHASYCPRIVEDGFEMRVLGFRARQNWNFDEKDVGKTLSVIAMSPKTCVSERGFEWNLDHVDLEQWSDLGISNMISEKSAEIVCHNGRMLVYCMKHR